MLFRSDVLLEAADILRREGAHFSLTLAGDGPQAGDLIDQAGKLGLNDWVKFPGFVPNNSLPALLSRHDLYIALSPTDGVSASLLEAMAVGLFPIVPNHAANRLWVEDRKNGWLLDDLSPSKVAAAVRGAASDISLREYGWRTNANLVREQADLDRNCERYADRFQQLSMAGQVNTWS